MQRPLPVLPEDISMVEAAVLFEQEAFRVLSVQKMRHARVPADGHLVGLISFGGGGGMDFTDPIRDYRDPVMSLLEWKPFFFPTCQIRNQDVRSEANSGFMIIVDPPGFPLSPNWYGGAPIKYAANSLRESNNPDLWTLLL
jgi:hypothetical protein